MKRFFVIVLCLFNILLSGCFKNLPGKKASDSGKPKVDIDFTKMNYNMVSAKLFNVLIDSEKYLGKSIRFRGQYFVTEEESVGQQMHSVLIYDSTACCQTGLQFELSEGLDYPAEKTEIEITGKLAYREVNSMDYYYVACNDISIME